MRIGIVGAGNIGKILTRKLTDAGHQVKLTDRRGRTAIRDRATELGGVAVDSEDVGRDVDVVILAIPTSAVPSIAGPLASLPPEVVVVDTSNYYPFRDGSIADLDNGKVESIWVSEQIGRPVIKAFNAALAHTQAEKGQPSDTPKRIAMPVAGDDQRAKKVACELVEAAGFDAIDAGGIADSWRQQPGTPAYCTELTADELREALAAADRAKAPELRETLIRQFMEAGGALAHDDVVARNRAVTTPTKRTG